MLLMGDEVRRTQGGNNNAYCQNNEISWFDWSLVEKHADIHRFVKALIAFRMNRDLPIERLDMTLNELLHRQPVQWHGVKLNAPDWGDQSHSLAATVSLLGYRALLHLIINAYWEALEFDIPARDRTEFVATVCRYLSRSAATIFAAGPMRRVCRARPAWFSRAPWSFCLPGPGRGGFLIASTRAVRLPALWPCAAAPPRSPAPRRVRQIPDTTPRACVTRLNLASHLPRAYSRKSRCRAKGSTLTWIN